MQRVTLNRILVPLDFSDPARSALAYAAGLGHTFGAELVLLYVAEPPPFSPDLTDSHGYEEKITAHGRQQLQAVTQEYLDQGVKTRAVVRFGRPAAEIVAAARDEQVDLIIMATHGRSGLKHLVGSVTEKVVRLATRPVLVTHFGRNEEPVEAGVAPDVAV
jgi:nucleotide-binding universal stress UspA family protein